MAVMKPLVLVEAVGDVFVRAAGVGGEDLVPGVNVTEGLAEAFSVFIPNAVRRMQGVDLPLKRGNEHAEVFHRLHGKPHMPVPDVDVQAAGLIHGGAEVGRDQHHGLADLLQGEVREEVSRRLNFDAARAQLAPIRPHRRIERRIYRAVSIHSPFLIPARLHDRVRGDPMVPQQHRDPRTYQPVELAFRQPGAIRPRGPHHRFRAPQLRFVLILREVYDEFKFHPERDGQRHFHGSCG